MRTNRPGGLDLTRKAAESCGFEPGEKVLDAGCGFGATVRFLIREKGVQAVGVDAGSLRLVQGQEEGGFSAVAAALEALPFRPGVFDGIFCECVLSLMPDKNACLEAFFRLLKPGGRLVLADLVLPDPAHPAHMVPPACNPPVTCLDGAMTLEALAMAVEKAGFEIFCREDHTPLLKQMACEMVFEHGSMDAFWQHLTCDVINTGLAGACRQGKLKPGYAMIIARRV